MFKTLKKILDRYPLVAELILILIITIPAFSVLLNNQFFTMHDFQHVARLSLLDLGLKQGQVYPRWVDTLGFGFGYPLFNFYPPLIYYLAEIFHLLGMSFIVSVKMVIFLGFFLGAYGTFLFAKKLTDKKTALLAATLFTFFLYRGVLVYVRGALAEFFAMSLLPFVFLACHNLFKKNNLPTAVYLGISISFLILSHSLIAMPSLFFIGAFFIFYYYQSVDKKQFIKLSLIGFIVALSLSAFFWLPSLSERKYTMVDEILTRELASYKIHYVEPQQFINSLWGYGGSGPGLTDAMSFQVGKFHILLIAASLMIFAIYLKRKDEVNKYYVFFLLLLFFSLFMATSYSSFIWDNLRPLWYLQFPWRFLTFTGFFASIVGAYSLYMISQILKKNRYGKIITFAAFYFFIQTALFVYPKYFHPEAFLKSSDSDLTSFNEIAGRISATSFEFIPKGVKTTKSAYDTTIPDIKKTMISEDTFRIIPDLGLVKVTPTEKKVIHKGFSVTGLSDFTFRLNTFNFPGWKAYVDSQEAVINDNNEYKLITISVPRGQHTIDFFFKDTPVRTVGNIISLSAILIIASYEIRRRILRSQFKKIEA